MTEFLPTMEGEARDPALSQWFTPPDLAERVATWALKGFEGVQKVKLLEPAAGDGALIWPALRTGQVLSVTAFEIDPMHVARLVRPPIGPRDDVRCEDFMAAADIGQHHLALCNTPYEDGQDVAFAAKCFKHAYRVVGIYPARMLHSQGRAEFWRTTHICRMAILSWRPSFGGGTGQTDFVVMDLQSILAPGDRKPTQLEWWSK